MISKLFYLGHIAIGCGSVLTFRYPESNIGLQVSIIGLLAVMDGHATALLKITNALIEDNIALRKEVYELRGKK
jgi:hypothetical protein